MRVGRGGVHGVWIGRVRGLCVSVCGVEEAGREKGRLEGITGCKCSNLLHVFRVCGGETIVQHRKKAERKHL